MTASTCAVWEESFHGCVWAMAPHARGEPLEHMSAGSRGLPASAAILARWLPGSARIQGEVCTCPVAAGWTAREAPPPDADDGALAGDSPDMPIFSGASAGGVEEPREGAADQQPHTEGAGGGHAAADGADAARGSSDKGGATDARADPGGSLGAAGPGSDGSPPGSGTETVGPPSGTEGGSRGAGQGHPGAVIPPDAPRLNYASSSMGAKVIHANPGAKKSSEVLTESSATYTLSPCPNDRWLVVEMPQEVLGESASGAGSHARLMRAEPFCDAGQQLGVLLLRSQLPFPALIHGRQAPHGATVCRWLHVTAHPRLIVCPCSGLSGLGGLRDALVASQGLRSLFEEISADPRQRGAPQLGRWVGRCVAQAARRMAFTCSTCALETSAVLGACYRT